MATALNVESLEEMKRQFDVAKEMVEKLTKEPLPNDVYEAISEGWLTTGSHAFEQLTTALSHDDLRHWHTRVVKCEDILTALQSLHDKSVHMFADSVASKTAKVMGKPLKQAEWLLEHEGMLLEVLLHIEEGMAALTIAAMQIVDASLPPPEAGWIPFFEALPNLPATAGAKLEVAKELIKQQTLALIKPLLERAVYEVIFVAFVMWVSTDAVKKLYLPLHRTRDDAHRFIISKMLPQRSHRFGNTKKLKPVHLTISSGLVPGVAVSKAVRGTERFKRRRRSSRGKTRLIDVLLPPRKGRKSKAELRLIAKKNQVKKALALARRRKAQLKRIANLRTEIKKYPEKVLKQMSKAEAAAKRELKHRYKRAKDEALERLKEPVRQFREETADELRKNKRHYFPAMPNALGR